MSKQITMTPRRIFNLFMLYAAAALAAALILSVLGCSDAPASSPTRIRIESQWKSLGHGVEVIEVKSTGRVHPCFVARFGDDVEISCQ